MKVEVLRSMTLRSNGFGIEPELTATIFKRGSRVYEVPLTCEGQHPADNRFNRGTLVIHGHHH